ncbi:hypothetical protein ACFQ7F_43780 [Streptomyces sp. NPDC056486]|uniref:hypothetical protein n=1 Tax=Streptomyces sp. NPDC056486 TaxID=3345835 RepID=UPI00369F1211
MRRAWAAGQSAEVRITGADVLRISAPLAAAVLDILAERGTPLGLTLDTRTRGTVEITVPAGTAASWPPLPGTRCVSDAVLRCPAPEVTTDHGPGSGGHAWTVPPTRTPYITVTDADVLAEAVTVAHAHRCRSGAASPSSGPGGHA